MLRACVVSVAASLQLLAMTGRIVVCLFDAVVDEWWTFCEPAEGLELRLLLNWLSMLVDDNTLLTPLRVFKLDCAPNPVGWTSVMVVVFVHKPKVWNLSVIPAGLMLQDLGIPVTWLATMQFASVPLNVKFRWELVAGASEDVPPVDFNLPVRMLMMPHTSRSPPVRMRRIWHDLAVRLLTPCSPEVGHA